MYRSCSVAVTIYLLNALEPEYKARDITDLYPLTASFLHPQRKGRIVHVQLSCTVLYLQDP